MELTLQTMNSGWMEVELEVNLEMDLNHPNQLRLDRGGARHGVDPPSPKVRHKWNWKWSGPSKGRTQI